MAHTKNVVGGNIVDKGEGTRGYLRRDYDFVRGIGDDTDDGPSTGDFGRW